MRRLLDEVGKWLVVSLIKICKCWRGLILVLCLTTLCKRLEVNVVCILKVCLSGACYSLKQFCRWFQVGVVYSLKQVRKWLKRDSGDDGSSSISKDYQFVHHRHSTSKPNPSSSSFLFYYRNTSNPTKFEREFFTKFNPSSSSLSLRHNTSSPTWLERENFTKFSPCSSSAVSSPESTGFRVRSNTSPKYEIPKNITELIKRNDVPDVLKKSLSLSNYKDYFASLLYAEDYYIEIEKWSDFCLSNITLELHKASIYEKQNKLVQKSERDDKFFVAFEIDSIPERRPFLLSRDFVLVRPSGKTLEPFQGILYRVVRNTTVLVDFKEDFHAQHRRCCKYDVSFSFNRVCLKRCHRAIETAAANPSLSSFLFPYCSIPSSFMSSHLKPYEKHARNVCNLNGPPPYLIEGPPSVASGKLSRTGILIQDIVLQMLRTSLNSRILLCAPLNNTCDVLMRSLKRQIPKSDVFRANAAFRDLDGVPDDILSSCSYEGECFTCPSFEELKNFKVIISTFVSSFRLSTEGICSGHFSHIFMVDASFATEPEAMVTLANLVGERTVVVVSGTQGNFSSWVRSDIGRKYGLQKSYFQRLLETLPKSSLHQPCITRIG